ncbi:MAG: M24 family metallopeptidase, partial [Terriglobia bacterium]
MIPTKSRSELQKISKAARIVAQALATFEERLRPGVRASDLDKVVDAFIRHAGGIPAFKGYQGYPAATCVSFNEAVVHGIPDTRAAREGDLVSVDIGVEVDGYFGDGAVTIPVGRVSDEAAKLVKIAKRALQAGVAECRIGKRLYDISNA